MEPGPFAAYGPALAAIAGWSLLTVGLLLGSAVGAARATTPSGHPVRDYSDPYYRRGRAFANAVETTGPFLAALVAAILGGASPFWVNLLAVVFLAARVAMAAVHVGTEIQPLRSAFWGIGLLCCLALAALALAAAFS